MNEALRRRVLNITRASVGGIMKRSGGYLHRVVKRNQIWYKTKAGKAIKAKKAIWYERKIPKRTLKKMGKTDPYGRLSYGLHRVTNRDYSYFKDYPHNKRGSVRRFIQTRGRDKTTDPDSYQSFVRENFHKFYKGRGPEEARDVMKIYIGPEWEKEKQRRLRGVTRTPRPRQQTPAAAPPRKSTRESKAVKRLGFDGKGMSAAHRRLLLKRGMSFYLIHHSCLNFKNHSSLPQIPLRCEKNSTAQTRVWQIRKSIHARPCCLLHTQTSSCARGPLCPILHLQKIANSPTHYPQNSIRGIHSVGSIFTDLAGEIQYFYGHSVGRSFCLWICCSSS